MKTKTKNEHYRESLHHPVNYQWSGSDGTICRGHTVAAGRSRAEAERRFFKQHSHVLPDLQDR
jgi:hypothetical protein